MSHSATRIHQLFHELYCLGKGVKAIFMFNNICKHCPIFVCLFLVSKAHKSKQLKRCHGHCACACQRLCISSPGNYSTKKISLRVLSSLHNAPSLLVCFHSQPREQTSSMDSILSVLQTLIIALSALLRVHIWVYHRICGVKSHWQA
jgi:hypothetical protein